MNSSLIDRLASPAAFVSGERIIPPAVQQAAPSVPGPKDARGWQIGLGCFAFLSMIPAAIAGPFLFGWLALGRYEALSFPTAAFLCYLPAVASIGLGMWTWRTKKVRRFASLAAILGGAFGVSFAALFAFFGLVLRFSPGS